ncbi:MAG: polymerase subunit sigma-70 [Acidimicrobiales bacterium]|nr:polymerase subunit sigma-70 [Acidimicrobiales bacterium]
MAEPSDDALIAGMAARDPDAAAGLLRRHQQRAFGLALGILGDRGRAEDAAQEGFVRAWRHADAFDPRRGSATGWLLTIVRNAALDQLRAERARPVEVLDVRLAAIASGVGPEDEAVMESEVARVRAALRQLPDAQRRAVVLAAFGGRTAREVSAIDGIPLGTAKTRIRDGLRQLRRTLDAHTATEPRAARP